jgi:NTP pyrophosphatase (non-canonical NTP hydrolase)
MALAIEDRGSSFFFKLRVAIGTVAITQYALVAAHLFVSLPDWVYVATLAASLPIGLLWAFRPEERATPHLSLKAVEPLTDIDEYGEFVRSMWVGGSTDAPDVRQLAIMSLGLGGESGEVQDLIKKHLRDGVIDRDHLRKELGDTLYYAIRISQAYGFLPSEVLGANREKLLDRASRGVLQGTGDNR